MQDQIDVTVVHTEVVPSQFEITNGDNFSCNIVALMDTLKMLSWNSFTFLHNCEKCKANPKNFPKIPYLNILSGVYNQK